MKSWIHFVAQSLTVCALSIAGQGVMACPFCDAPTTTFSEQLSTAKSVALVQWNAVEKPDPLDFSPGSTTYEAVQVYRKFGQSIEPKQQVTIPYYQEGAKGDLFWLLGNVAEGQHNWALPMAMSRDCWNYIVNAPGRDTESAVRLSYYLKFLEHPDLNIAIDAYGEFAGTPYEGLLTIRKELPREKVRQWLFDPQITPTRRGLYGLMLGLSGNDSDRQLLEKAIFEKAADYQVGLDGMMAGYVLLSGEKGLKRLADEKLSNQHAADYELFAAMQTLRFLWQFTSDLVPHRDLQHAMKAIMQRPKFAGLAIIDLARWQDWSLGTQLEQSYDSGEFRDADTKQAVVRYMILLSQQADPKTHTEQEAALRFLDRLREKEPAFLKSVERHSFD